MTMPASDLPVKETSLESKDLSAALPRVRHWALRVAILVLGTVVTLLGVVIMPLPGPLGTPVILLGLGILSAESSHARRIMGKIKARLHSRKSQIHPPTSRDEGNRGGHA